MFTGYVSGLLSPCPLLLRRNSRTPRTLHWANLSIVGHFTYQRKTYLILHHSQRMDGRLRIRIEPFGAGLDYRYA